MQHLPADDDVLEYESEKGNRVVDGSLVSAREDKPKARKKKAHKSHKKLPAIK